MKHRQLADSIAAIYQAELDVTKTVGVIGACIGAYVVARGIVRVVTAVANWLPFPTGIDLGSDRRQQYMPALSTQLKEKVQKMSSTPRHTLNSPQSKSFSPCTVFAHFRTACMPLLTLISWTSKFGPSNDALSGFPGHWAAALAPSAPLQYPPRRLSGVSHCFCDEGTRQELLIRRVFRLCRFSPTIHSTLPEGFLFYLFNVRSSR
jgi:hypothetical protein